MLTDRKNLGVHSEMVSDGVIPLIEAGVINGALKNFKPRKIIVGFLLGTKRIFDYVDNNRSSNSIRPLTSMTPA